MNDDPLVLAPEILRLLTFTQTFSNSFGIRRTRVRNWRLMGIVMELENSGRVNPRLLRQRIKPLIPEDRSSDALHQTQYRYVREFQNPEGELLSPVYKNNPPAAHPEAALGRQRIRKPNLQSYELNENFEACEYKYVSTFLQSVASELKNAKLEKGDPRVRALFKTLLVFQRKNYLPLWLKLVDDIKAVCARGKRNQSDFSEWAAHDPTWVMLLSIWLHKLQNPE